MEAEGLVQGAIVNEDGEQGEDIEHMKLEDNVRKTSAIESSDRIPGQFPTA